MRNSMLVKVYSSLLAALSIAAFSAQACLPLLPPPCPESSLDKLSSKALNQRIIDTVANSCMARCAVQSLVKRGPSTIPIFLDLMKKDVTRKLAIDGLSALGKDAAPAVPTLIKFMHDPKSRDDVIGALANIGDAAADAVPGLMRFASSRDEGTAWIGIWGLNNIGKSATPAIPLLAAIALSDNTFPSGLAVQNAAAATLGKLGQYDPASAGPSLVKLIERPGLQDGVSEGILFMGPAVKPWSSELRAGLFSALVDVRKRESELTGSPDSKTSGALVSIRNVKDELERALVSIPDAAGNQPQ